MPERLDVRGAQVVAAHMDITIENQVDRDLLEMYRQSTILSQSVVSMEPVYGNAVQAACGMQCLNGR